MSMQKIDRHGNYLPYPGITIICELFNKNGWDQVYNLIRNNPTISKIYSALPVSSYHMTLLDIISQGETNIPMNQIINSNYQLLYNTNNVLVSSHFIPIPKVCRMYARNTIGLVLEFDSELLQKIHQFRGFLGSHLNITPNNTYVFHMTLAYRYSEGQIDDCELQKLHNQINNIITPYDYKLQFNHPKLCYFNDMTSFNELFCRKNFNY